ncbi:hypothetical protein CHH83_05980 [Bacillus sp. 7586-K]|nr:hypothetical protein CHH83_05980 [Bacillus sp. 7586-K]
MEELLDLVLKTLGKTQAQFEAEVEEAKKESSIENIANLMAILMQNADFTANIISTLIQEVAMLKDRIAELEGSTQS